jgi:hypothetical protein
VFTYAIAAANTWEQKTVTVPGDTSGTWATGNTMGLQVVWDLGSGSNLNGTAGTWASGFDTRTSGAVSLNGTNGATFYITGVQLERGSNATSFEFRDYGRELAMCQRYYEISVSVSTGSSGGGWSSSIPFKASKRASPTITVITNFNGSLDSIQHVTTDYAVGAMTLSGGTARSSVAISIEL